MFDQFVSSIKQCSILEDSKCPKILYTKVSHKMEYANSADPDQTASGGAV